MKREDIKVGMKVIAARNTGKVAWNNAGKMKVGDKGTVIVVSDDDIEVDTGERAWYYHPDDLEIDIKSIEEELAKAEAEVARIKAELAAIPPKKKRLMTPAECAGKWICKEGERVLVCGYLNGSLITTAHAVTSTVKEIHERGWMIADTPTSEPYSLEIEE